MVVWGGEIDSLPEEDFPPLQPPEATQEILVLSGKNPAGHLWERLDDQERPVVLIEAL